MINAFPLSQLDVNAFTFDFMVETSLLTTTKRGMNDMQRISCALNITIFFINVKKIIANQDYGPNMFT